VAITRTQGTGPSTHRTWHTSLAPPPPPPPTDEVVFSCDIDRSGDALANLQGEPEFWGASGCLTAALGEQASRQHSGARMHMPPEFRHADPASDCSFGENVFTKLDQNQAEHVERAERSPAFLGSAGSKSGKINEQVTHQCYGRIQNQARARVYNVQAAPTKAPVVLLSAGHLEDCELGENVLSREKVAEFSRGVAGQSSIDRNVASEAYDRAERGRAIVPRRESKVADFISPLTLALALTLTPTPTPTLTLTLTPTPTPTLTRSPTSSTPPPRASPSSRSGSRRIRTSSVGSSTRPTRTTSRPASPRTRSTRTPTGRWFISTATHARRSGWRSQKSVALTCDF